jgi:hypothetical protein
VRVCPEDIAIQRPRASALIEYPVVGAAVAPLACLSLHE